MKRSLMVAGGIMVILTGMTGCGLSWSRWTNGPSSSEPTPSKVTGNSTGVTKNTSGQAVSVDRQNITVSLGTPSNSLNGSSGNFTEFGSPENAIGAIDHADPGPNGTTGTQNSLVSGTATTVPSKYPQQATEHLVAEVWQLPPGQVALTIDDGPSPYTSDIVQVLQHYHVPATFFFVGRQVQAYPMGIQAAVAAGMEIGDHTVSHPELTLLSPADQKWQILHAITEIQQYYPHPVTLFRPPYEAFNNSTEEILAQNHVALALWNLDPRDWQAHTPQQIVHNVLSQHPSGAVIDLHDKRLTLESLPSLITALQKLGLQFVPLPTPVGYSGVKN